MVYEDNYPPWMEHDQRVRQPKKLSNVSLRLLRPFVPANATSPPSASSQSPPEWNTYPQKKIGSLGDDNKPMMDYANRDSSSANILASIRRPSSSADATRSPQCRESPTSAPNLLSERSENLYNPQTAARDSADKGGLPKISSSAAYILQSLRRPGMSINSTPSPKSDEMTPTWPSTDEKNANATQNQPSMAGLKPADRIRRIREILPAQEPTKNFKIVDKMDDQFDKSPTESFDYSHQFFSPHITIPTHPLRRPHQY